MDNATRFINAYNRIDNCLRSVYNFGPSMSFADIIRRCADKSYIVRANEQLLFDFSRLRNAIVHKSTEEMIIAQPHDDVTRQIEQLAKLISTPPSAVSLFGSRKVTLMHADTKLKDAIKMIIDTHYSNIPVYRGNQLKGILNNKIIVERIGGQIARGRSVDEYLESETAEGALNENYFGTYYKLCPASVTIDEVVEMFSQNRKLLAVLITRDGRRNQKSVCIITTYDLAKIYNTLDDYV